MMKSRERMGWTAPVVSHWGISGGRFPELAGPTAGEAHFVPDLQLFGKQGPAGERVLASLMKKFPEIKGPEDVFSPVGTANAYDAMHLMARAIDKAGSTDGDAIREAMYEIGTYEGLIKTYDNPSRPATTTRSDRPTTSWSTTRATRSRRRIDFGRRQGRRPAGPATRLIPVERTAAASRHPFRPCRDSARAVPRGGSRSESAPPAQET